MKKTFLFLAVCTMMSTVFSSCEKKQVNSLKANLETSVEAPISYEGAELVLNIEANVPWTVKSEKEVVATPATGNGNTKVTLAVSPNEGDVKTHTVKVISEGLPEQVFTFQQEAKPSLDAKFSTDVTDPISYEGAELSVIVEANMKWELQCDDKLVASVKNGEGNATVKLTVPANDSKEQITYEIKVVGENNQEKVLTFKQSAKPYLEVTSDVNMDEPIAAAATDIKLTIKSNTAWTIKNDDFITVSQASGKDNATVTLSVSANGMEERELTISVEGENVETITFKATQKANDEVVDADGNVYKIVKIGEQIWMQSNLKTTKYNDGTAIQYYAGALSYTETSDWEKNTNKTAAYTYYKNDKTFIEKYGLLYNHKAVKTEKLCPEGWTVPNRTQWKELADFAGGELGQMAAATPLKATEGWDVTSGKECNGTNTTGFTALPSGSCHYFGTYSAAGSQAFWWASNGPSDDTPFYAELAHYQKQMYLSYTEAGKGFAIRCIKK